MRTKEDQTEQQTEGKIEHKESNIIADKIVLFDGICHFCDASVQFIIQRDSKRLFKFAPLQSGPGEKLIQQFNIPPSIDSFILIDHQPNHQHVHYKSSAVLHVCKHLKGLWKLLYILIIIPKPLRDFCYEQFAKRRYKWFGSKESCMIPTPEQRERFL